jgi:hypothetical protein
MRALKPITVSCRSIYYGGDWIRRQKQQRAEPFTSRAIRAKEGVYLA